ncbi:hypothetical protein POVWA2_013000 [Plasmodium ovale wallikeri]|uniref:Uncharacterized protein n=1 Tax=Plasmodium ovale wallikeri TaxID=864142 RepID=A0A1A8YLP8_PLAOA|nr:hypothetical protein POVWA1_012330 [Plasmodium ovale wallikeri]SBT33098.1 hypothetical protein POVWA2_013000 [Plasmodium ovale wallikeri]
MLHVHIRLCLGGRRVKQSVARRYEQSAVPMGRNGLLFCNQKDWWVLRNVCDGSQNFFFFFFFFLWKCLHFREDCVFVWLGGGEVIWRTFHSLLLFLTILYTIYDENVRGETLGYALPLVVSTIYKRVNGCDVILLCQKPPPPPNGFLPHYDIHGDQCCQRI